MNRLALVLVLFLSACGSEKGAVEQTAGGMVGVYEPVGDLKCHFIVHQGHAFFNGSTGRNGGPPVARWDLTPMSLTFAEHGCRVYAFEMPPRPHDSGPIELYYGPVIELLDQLSQDGNTLPVYMAGFSGGGGTTVMALYFDSRITKGYAIEGGPDGCDPTEWEMMWLCDNDQWHVMYAAIGDRLFNFTSFPFPDYPNFYGVRDPTATTHEVTEWQVNYILKDLGL